MKKLLLCGLAAVMILALAACGNNSGDKNDDQSGKQARTGSKQGAQELVPEWVDGQEYPQGEDEPADAGTNALSDGNQKEEPNQYNIGFN